MDSESMVRWSWNPDRNANETFEDIAEWFHDDTHYLRPGKSYPMGYAPPEDEQRKAWEAWREQKAREFLVGLTRLREIERLAGELVEYINSDDLLHCDPDLERYTTTLKAKIKPVQLSDTCPECQRPWKGPDHCTCGSLKGEF